MKSWQELDCVNDEIAKEALDQAISLFPYDDDNLTDDINSAKRLIYVNAFLNGIEYFEEQEKTIVIQTNFIK